MQRKVLDVKINDSKGNINDSGDEIAEVLEV